jgi:hypothetical protein
MIGLHKQKEERHHAHGPLKPPKHYGTSIGAERARVHCRLMHLKGLKLGHRRYGFGLAAPSAGVLVGRRRITSALAEPGRAARRFAGRRVANGGATGPAAR